MQNFILTADKIKENIHFFKTNSDKGYADMVQQIVKSDPFGGNKFYIYQFVKRVDDATGVKKMYHQARLTKPDPVPGTSLLRCDPKDPYHAEIIWTLPDFESIELFKYGKFFADEFVHNCIEQFLRDPDSMCRPEKDDLSEEQIKEIYSGMRKK